MKKTSLLLATMILFMSSAFSQSVKIKWKQIQTGTPGQVAIVGVNGLGEWVTPPFLNISDTAAMLAIYVRQSREITINGTTHDLSQDRTWTLTKADVGLSNVNNTSDLNKPISTATQNALNAKADDNAVVHKTGAENVGGVKTFSSSPIVPTPTTNTQAANKQYVDNAISTNNNNYIPTSEKGANNGVATLDANGKLPSSQVPSLAITETYVVNSTATMLALSAEVGDVAIRTDSNMTFILQTEPATAYGNWKEVLTPYDGVQSVNGNTGPNVVITTDDVSEGSNNLYYTSTRARQSISSGAGINYNSGTGVITNSAPNVQSNLAIGTKTGSTVAITNSDGTGVTLPAATSTDAGLLTAAQKLKLDSLTNIAATGTVKSVAMTVPTGLTISGSPITTSGTLAVGLQSGYSIPTTNNQNNWTSAYNNMIVSASVSGTTTKTATLTQQDGGTITFNWTDLQDAYTDEGVAVTGSTSNTITLPHVPTPNKHLIAQMNGVTLSPNDWSVSGTTVTLSNITREASDHFYFFYSY